MKRLFMKKAPKEASHEENKEYLESIGVSTFKGNRERKFGGFSEYAREVAAKGKKDYSSSGVQTQSDDIYRKQEEQIYGPGGNPYAQARADRQAAKAQAAAAPAEPAAANPYAQANMNLNSYEAQANPYAQGGPGAQRGAGVQGQGAQSGAQGASSQSAPTASSSANPYAQDTTAGNPYAQTTSGANPYASQATSAKPPSQYAESTYAPSNAREELFGGRSGRQHNFDYDDNAELDELNEAPDAELDELNELPDSSRVQTRRSEAAGGAGGAQAGGYGGYGGQSAQEQQEQEDDEELEELRNQIKFTKKESLSSTQNTLRLAAEAEASGRNALGMLGSQGERIANTERSLALAKNQTKVAAEKNAELARLNRSIFVPNVSNPFTSKRRLQEKEARIKSEYAQEQVAREHRRQNAFESERRVIEGLNSNGVSYSDTAMKHKKEQMRNNEGRKKFQFEADSEDEDLEDELELNLEGISNAAGRMKGLAQSMGDEVESQNRRLERITRQTDELDIDVHLNAARLAAIK